MLSMLINVIKVRYLLKVESPEIRVGLFYGTRLRGALGYFLKKISCKQKQSSCGQCMLKTFCVYQRFYEDAGIRPWRLIPPSSGTYRFGDTLTFEIVFFDDFGLHIPFVTLAIKEMGLKGIGKDNTDRYELVEAHAQSLSKVELPIYHEGELNYNHQDFSSAFLENESEGNEKQITVFFKTPLRLKNENHLVTSLDERIFWEACLDRIKSLGSSIGAEYSSFDLTLVAAKSKWLEHKRYSTRQKSNMQLGGVVGEITLEGDVKKYKKIFSLIEMTGLGKATTFWFGHVEFKG